MEDECNGKEVTNMGIIRKEIRIVQRKDIHQAMFRIALFI